jgi:predicted nucleotidyltransferase component of viral defense system
LIPLGYLQEWSTKAPWPDLRQVEQDLIICRALCDLFTAPKLKGKIALRGGSAINKLLFRQPLRYSEDIDLVQLRAERIGPTIDAIGEALAWLGDCHRDRAGHSTHLTFRFAPEVQPDATLNVKVEVNTREHESLLGVKTYPFELAGDWHQTKAEVVSFEAEELFGTKLRALLQRRQGRDLFDLDVDPLLPAGVRFNEADAIEAFGRVWSQLIARIRGDAWKKTDRAVEELRQKYPNLLT